MRLVCTDIILFDTDIFVVQVLGIDILMGCKGLLQALYFVFLFLFFNCMPVASILFNTLTYACRLQNRRSSLLLCSAT